MADPRMADDHLASGAASALALKPADPAAWQRVMEEIDDDGEVSKDAAHAAGRRRQERREEPQ